MQVAVLVGLILTAGLIAVADESGSTAGEKSKKPIAMALPDAYSAYEKMLAQGRGTNGVLASLELLAKAKEALRGSLINTGKDQDLVAAYSATWRLCIQSMQDSTNGATQRLILDEWNKSLREDDDAVPSQIWALAEQWDRNLLTDEFWQLLRQTGKKKTMAAIAFVLYEHGDASDLDRLIQKRKSGVDVDSQETIQNAINWMNYRLSGDKANPGPAAAPPRME